MDPYVVASFGQLLDEELKHFHRFVDHGLELVNAQKAVHTKYDLPIKRIQPDTAILQYTIDPNQVPVNRKFHFLFFHSQWDVISHDCTATCNLA